MSDRAPTFGQLLREAMESRLAELHVSMPCKVVSYDSEKNTVDVQPLFKKRRRDANGDKTVTSFKPIQNVPVAFLRSSKAWVTIPLQAGDLGMLVFAERSVADWMETSAGREVEPSEDSLHPLNGAWFHPGGYPSKSPIDPTNSSHPVFHTETELHLGEQGLSDNQFVAIAKLVKDELTALKNAVSSASVTSSCTAGGATGTIVLTHTVGEVKATKVKAK